MTAVAVLARAELRRRWLALVLLGVLAGIVGGAVLGSLAAARRTSTAFDRLAAVTHAGDAKVLTFGPDAARVAELPAVESSRLANLYIGQLQGPDVVYVVFVGGSAPPGGLFTPLITDGRAADPDRANEVVITEDFERLSGLHVGDQVPLKLLTGEEVTMFDEGFGEPDGPPVTLDVVGVGRIPSDASGSVNILAGDALVRELPDDVVVGSAVFVDAGGDANVDELLTELDEAAAAVPKRPGAEEFDPFTIMLTREAEKPVAAASRVLVGGLVAFAAIALVVGGVALVQAFGRYQAAGIQSQRIEEALGVTRVERALARAMPAVVPALVGAVVAVAIAIAVSPATPIGSLTRFEPDPGVDVNVGLLALGAFGVVVLVVLCAGVTALRASRAAARATPLQPSAVAERLAGMGGSAPAVLGIRFAFERGRGRSAVPVRSALAGAVVGVAGVVAVAGFAASLHRLIATPERFGWQGDLTVADIKPDRIAQLEGDPNVAALAVVHAATVRMLPPGAPPVAISGYGFDVRKGSLGWTMLDGRMPASRDEVAVSTTIADRYGLAVGDLLDFEGGELAVVGVGIGPVTGNGTPGVEVALTESGLERLASNQPFVEGYVKLGDSVHADAYVKQLSTEVEVDTVHPPNEVDNLGQLGRLPDLLGLFLAALAIAAVGNALVIGVRRRRGDLAVLRTLGFTGRQLAATILTMGLATIAVGIIFGVPLGLIIGGLVWRAVAESAHVAGDLARPVLLLALVVPAGVVAAALLGLLPARRAQAVHPAVALRSE